MPQFTEMRPPAIWADRRPGVRSAVNGHPAGLPIRRRMVVLGYDGSEAARSGLGRAAEEAGTEGRILVITSIPPADGPDGEGGMVPGDEAMRLLDEARALLRDHDVEVATRLEVGDPAEVLAAAAGETGADLIVVGARGRNFLARALRGSVAERLVTRAPCALLVVR